MAAAAAAPGPIRRSQASTGTALQVAFGMTFGEAGPADYRIRFFLRLGGLDVGEAVGDLDCDCAIITMLNGL